MGAQLEQEPHGDPEGRAGSIEERTPVSTQEDASSLRLGLLEEFRDLGLHGMCIYPHLLLCFSPACALKVRGRGRQKGRLPGVPLGKRLVRRKSEGGIGKGSTENSKNKHSRTGLDALLRIIQF